MSKWKSEVQKGVKRQEDGNEANRKARRKDRKQSAFNEVKD
jgi:hypothetical protein